jgi:hypothetical protein
MAGQRLCFGWPGSADRGRRRQAGVILRTGRALLSEVSLFEVVPRPPPAAPEAKKMGDSADINPEQMLGLILIETIRLTECLTATHKERER